MSCYVISNGTFYAVSTRSNQLYHCAPAGYNELYHYGVKGMKWGVRRADRQASQVLANHYASRADKHVSKIATSKTQLGKNYHNYRAYRNEIKSGNKQLRADRGGEGGILKKLDNVYGHGRDARLQTAASNYYDRKGDYVKSNLRGSMAKARAYNLKTAAEANTRLHNSKKLSEYASNYIDSVANRSIKTWSGRTTTTGKNMVDAMLTGGMIGSLQDIGHYAKKKSTAKKEYKSRTDKAFKEYENTIADIEKNYKRGQQLSDKDYAREEAADRKYQSEAKKAKEDYKKAMRR